MRSPRLLQRLLHLGTGAGLPVPVERRVLLSNQIALIVAVIAALGMTTGPEGDAAATRVAFIGLAAIAAAVPALNGLGRTRASRAVIVALPPLVLIGPPVLGGAVSLGFALAMPFALLTMSLLPVLLFHEPTERTPWRLGVAYLGLVLLAHDRLVAAGLEAADRAVLASAFADAKAAQMILWVLILATVRFLTEVDVDSRSDAAGDRASPCAGSTSNADGEESGAPQKM